MLTLALVSTLVTTLRGAIHMRLASRDSSRIHVTTPNTICIQYNMDKYHISPTTLGLSVSFSPSLVINQVPYGFNRTVIFTRIILLRIKMFESNVSASTSSSSLKASRNGLRTSMPKKRKGCFSVSGFRSTSLPSRYHSRSRCHHRCIYCLFRILYLIYSCTTYITCV
jgi:hypothetical protein